MKGWKASMRKAKLEELLKKIPETGKKYGSSILSPISDNSGKISKNLVIGLTVLTLAAGTIGYFAFCNNNNSSGEEPIPTVEETETPAQKNIDKILEEFSEYDVEVFPHGDISFILKDGRIGFYDGEQTRLYNNGVIEDFNTIDNNIAKTIAILNGENYYEGANINYINDKGESFLYIGDKPLKRPNGQTIKHDQVDHMALNSDGTKMAFLHIDPHDDYLSGPARTNYIALENLDEIDPITDFLNGITRYITTGGWITRIANVEEQINLSTFNFVVSYAGEDYTLSELHNSGKLLEATNGRYDLLETITGQKFREDDLDWELNTNRYSFKHLKLVDEEGNKYPNNEEYPNVSHLFWDDSNNEISTLYMRAKLNDLDEKYGIYKIIINHRLNEETKAIKLLHGGDKLNYTSDMFFDKEENKIYLITEVDEGHLWYLDLNKNNELTQISDIFTDGHIHGDSKLSFYDEYNNNFIVDLNRN